MPKRRSSNPRRSKNSRRRNVSKRRNVSRRNTREQRSSAGGADFGQFLNGVPVVEADLAVDAEPPIPSVQYTGVQQTGPHSLPSEVIEAHKAKAKKASTEASELAGAFGLTENPAWQDMVNNIVLKLFAKDSTTAVDMSEGLKTIGEQIMKDYVMDRKEYEENEVTGSLSKDQLERYLNISQYVGRAADQMKVPFYPGPKAEDKGGCLLGAKYSCQLGMFRNFFWKNIEDQLSPVKEAKSQDNNKAVISFNCFYKVDHLNEMLKKLTEDGDFDVVCMQELCGPWLVTNGMNNKSHVKNVDGNLTACDDDDAARVCRQRREPRVVVRVVRSGVETGRGSRTERDEERREARAQEGAVRRRG